MPFPVLHSRSDVLQMLDELTAGRKEILAACDKLSPAQLQDPVVPGTWSVLKNLTHLAWAEAYMLGVDQEAACSFAENGISAGTGRGHPAMYCTVFDEAHAEAIAFLKSNPESVLAEPCVYGRDANAQSVGGVFFHLVEHEIGHRAVVRFKLRQLQ